MTEREGSRVRDCSNSNRCGSSRRLEASNYKQQTEEQTEKRAAEREAHAI